MGQKVSPVGLRIGVNKSWQSNWYAEGKLNAKYIKNDDKIRKMLEKKLKDASVSSILIERDTKKTNVVINTAKPGVVIGHGGDEIEKLKNELTKLVEEINESKINFSIKFLNGETKQIVELLERVIPEKERINFYLSQITNYYYLYETNLLNTEVTLDQTAFAEQAFTDLVDEISGHLFSIDVIKNREVIKELRELLKKLAKKEEVAVLISSHNLAELESFCNVVSIILISNTLAVISSSINSV